MKTFDVGKTIITRVESENIMGSQQRVKGYADIINSKNEEKILWLVQGALKTGYTPQRNILGEVIGTTAGESPYLKAGGIVVSKNSPFGNALAELAGGTGTLTYRTDNGPITVTVLAKADYNLSPSGDDAVEGEIICTDEEALNFETSLKEKLKELAELIQKEKDKENLSEDELKALQQQIDDLKKEIDEKSKKARRYRRTSASIRQKFLLDQDQNKIKRAKLFNGPLVINGGPGTGKTTLLIHRIQYMLDPEIEKDENLTIILTEEEKSFLRNQKTGWIFFTPTDLLKKYLENAMVAEGLEAHDETVKTWEQQRALLKTALGLFNTETGRPFQSFSDKEHLWNLSPKQLGSLLKSFDAFFLNHFIKRIKKVSEIKLPDTEWKKDGQEIIRSLDLTNKDASIANLIVTLNDLVNRFSELRLSIDKQYKELMDNIAGNVQRKLTNEDREWFKTYLKERRTKKSEASNDEEEEEEEELIEAFEDEEVIDGKKLEIDINKLVKRVIRNAALAEIDKNTRVRKNDKEILEKIDKYYSKDSLGNVGALSLFTKYFKPFLRGSDNTILSQLPRVYKSFRKEAFENLEVISNTSKEKIKKIIATLPGNTRIHDDELDFLILNALRLARVFYQASPATFRESKNTTLNTFGNFMKGLVAVDEATDFTASQIACMYYLSRPRLNSITLCGDVMQQMNEQGIDNWENLEFILPQMEISSLVKSYRQTPRLLDLAIKLYKNRFGIEPKFYAAEKANEDDPYPLVCIDENFDNKMDWIAKRIVELFTVYENVIPNIAIFVKNNQSILDLADALNNNELLLNHAIKVKPCIGEGEIGSAEFVRVFNINLIKGMEFESVFFIDVDDYDENEIKILDKLIYVGLSRATYYLAITLKKDFPYLLQPIKDSFYDGNWSKDLESDY